MTDSARTEEIRARVEKDLDMWARRLACYNGADRQEVEKRQAWFRSELEQFTTAELTALREEVGMLKMKAYALDRANVLLDRLGIPPAQGRVCNDPNCETHIEHRIHTLSNRKAALSPSPAQEEPESA